MKPREPYRPQLFASPIDLPKREVGKFRITHRTIEGECIVVSMRQAIMRRTMRPVVGRLKRPRRIHELHESGDGVWMTDLPEELNQIGEALHNHPPHGRVLVGGLGLGILPAWIAERPAVEDVVVVEISPDVCDLTARPHLYRVVVGDIAEYLRTCGDFDCFYLDTWAGTNEAEWWRTVLPLRRIIRNRFGLRTVWCWAEDIMLGQIVESALLPKHWYYEALPEGITGNEVEWFLRNVGSTQWESKYGSAVDRALPGDWYRSAKRSG